MRPSCDPKATSKPPASDFRLGVWAGFGRSDALLAGARFAFSLTWLKAGLLAVRQIAPMNWQEMWSRDWPLP